MTNLKQTHMSMPELERGTSGRRGGYDDSSEIVKENSQEAKQISDAFLDVSSCTI